ncbi:MAG: 2-amino-4-hydroxy-6-hydroxymethyldihydropteridine diphosphokinase [Cellvibrionaceae bacterium]|nr:2-amino-4-hydroxy-6-hydroxymethyldihydropteridine diphosphokinase [Cellvibrionaceae bacterium]
MNRAFIGLGGNLGPVRDNLERALELLGQHPECRLIARSSWYQSRALVLDDEPQDDYLNAVCELRTELEPLPLLDLLQSIETQLGRQRHKRWGARTVDLDLLLYGQLELQTERLQLPHPGLGQRNFVLQPLLQLAPELRLPNGQSIAQAAATQGWEGLQKLEGDRP